MENKGELQRVIKGISEIYDLEIQNQVNINHFADVLDIVCTIRAQVERGAETYNSDDVEWGIALFCFPIPWAKDDGDEDENDKPKLRVRNALLGQVENTGDLQVFIPKHIFETESMTLYDFMIKHPEYEHSIISLEDLIDEFDDTDEVIDYICNYRDAKISGSDQDTIKTIRLTAESATSWEDAAQQAVTDANETLEGVNQVEIVNQTATIEHGEIVQYRATVYISFPIRR